MIYKGKIFDEERALYGVRNAVLEGCRFDGPADGESALKETAGLRIDDCDFLLRYPLWHTVDAEITNSRMTDTCRAALWYDRGIKISGSFLGGIKAVRECDNIEITDSEINSSEFGWMCRGIKMSSCEMNSEYPFLKSNGIYLYNINMKGKYSFQYTENVEIHNSILDTKDAFWHGRNISVYDSTVKGEYLGWYSDGLKFVRCRISGTQPLCYAENLVLEDCEMSGCDFSFERSSVNAKINGRITGVKNPMEGSITADGIDELIMDEYAADSTCEINIREGR